MTLKKGFVKLGAFALVATIFISTMSAAEVDPPYDRDEFLDAYQQQWDRSSVYYRRSERPTCMPELGEHSEQYQAFIDQYYPAGESEAQTVHYRLLESETRKPLPYVTLYIWSIDVADIDNTYFVMPVRSDKNGEITFTLNRKTGMAYRLNGPDCWQQDGSPFRIRITIDGVAYIDTSKTSVIKTTEGSDIKEILFEPVVPKEKFTDVPTLYWAYASIQAMSERGIIHGVGNSLFNPEGTITCAEFIAIVTRALVNDQIDATIKDTWYAANYKAAVDNGLIQKDEMPNTSTAMNMSISRYEMARILVRADENINKNGAVAITTNAIKDYANIPEEFQYYVAQAYSKGLLSGYSDGTFSGEQKMTRAQAAVVIERVLNAKVETPIAPDTDVLDFTS